MASSAFFAVAMTASTCVCSMASISVRRIISSSSAISTRIGVTGAGDGGDGTRCGRHRGVTDPDTEARVVPNHGRRISAPVADAEERAVALIDLARPNYVIQPRRKQIASADARSLAPTFA